MVYETPSLDKRTYNYTVFDYSGKLLTSIEIPTYLTKDWVSSRPRDTFTAAILRPERGWIFTYFDPETYMYEFYTIDWEDYIAR